MMRPIYSTALDPELTVDEIESSPVITLYPNPTNGQVHIKTSELNWTGMTVLGVDGKELYSTTEKYVDLSNEPNGMYFVRINGVNNLFKLMKY
jgi:hypothetical protein